MNDIGRDLVVWDCLERLDGFPTMEFNPSNERLFQACLATELTRPDDVVYPDRFMSIFRYDTRWGGLMELEMLLDPSKSVVDVAETAAFEAGPESVNTGIFIATAAIIMIKCWKYGEDLHEWLLESHFCGYLDNPHRLVFPLNYLHEPSNAKQAKLGWQMS